MTKPGSVQPLIVAMAVVVSTFIASLWSSQVSLGAVQDDARTITANAAPALEHLASARAELFRLRSHLGEDLATPSRSPALSRAQLDESGRRLEDHLAAYAALPNSPGEERLAEATLASLRRLIHSIALRSILAARLSGMPARGREFFEHVVRQLSRMNAIIEALLAFARAAANPDRTARAPLQAAVDGVVEEVREDARRQGVELAIGPVPRCSLACSEGVLSSVLSNLVRNALKYIGGGTGERRIALRARDVDGAVRVIVEDTGPGLPAGAEKAIFEPFVRLHAGRAPGLGLGLATVKRLIEAHGGHVGVDSTPGRGARFWFELPAAADADPLDGRQVARAAPG